MGYNPPCVAQRSASQDNYGVFVSLSIIDTYYWFNGLPSLKHRLLIAIDLPQDTKSELMRLQNDLAKFGVNADWKSADKLILELNYLGRIDDSLISPIKKITRNLTKDLGELFLTPVYLQALYSRHDPTEIFLTLNGDTDKLIDLQKQLCKEFRDIEIPQSKRYEPQITLGTLPRIDPTFTKQQIDKVDNFELSSLSSFEVNALSLFELFVTKIGTHIQKVGAFMLESVQI